MSFPIFDICPCPALYPYYHQENSIVVIVDVLRAGTSIVAAFAHGAKEIIPVATIEEAKSSLHKDHIIAAERNAMKCSWADLGNDPSEFTAERVGGRSIVFTTTNGTQAIDAARTAGAHEIIVGAFNNLSAVANHCITSGRSITVLASGWQNHFCLEDTLYGAALLDTLQTLGSDYPLTDSSRTALELYYAHADHLYNYLASCDHNQRLIERGYPNSLRFCLERDCYPLVPKLHSSGKLLVEYNVTNYPLAGL